MNFKASKRANMISLIFMVVGLLALIYLFVTDVSEHHGRFWSNVLINGLFFTFASLGALYFVALQYATETAWSVMARRIYEAIMSFLPYGLGVVILVLLLGQLHVHHLYHWMDSGLYKEVVINGEMVDLESAVIDGYDMTDEHQYADVLDRIERGETFTSSGNEVSMNPEYDYLIAGKEPFFSAPFFWLRQIVYVITFIIFMRAFRKRSLLEDEEGGTSLHVKNYKRGALFLVFFAVFSSVLAWDWVMSIDTHWFSTMFGWYVFSGMWVTAMILAVVIALYLRSKGLLPQFNDSHLHDMGKWMFAISFLWSYLWFCQFMLIWYSDIPEEVTYFDVRFDHFSAPMWIMFFINFALPMVILMARDSKRNAKFLITIGTIIFVGHWLDVWLMVTPATVHYSHEVSASHFQHAPGWEEICIMLGFLGVFMRVIYTKLAEAPLMPQKSPYLEESKQHHI